MTSFRLRETAFRDLDSLLANRMDEVGIDAAYDLRAGLFRAFTRVAEVPGLGHARPDLTRRPVVFFAVKLYLVIFDRRSDPLTIHAILDAARDVKRIPRSRHLQDRSFGASGGGYAICDYQVVGKPK